MPVGISGRRHGAACDTEKLASRLAPGLRELISALHVQGQHPAISKPSFQSQAFSRRVPRFYVCLAWNGTGRIRLSGSHLDW